MSSEILRIILGLAASATGAAASGVACSTRPPTPVLSDVNPAIVGAYNRPRYGASGDAVPFVNKSRLNFIGVVAEKAGKPIIRGLNVSGSRFFVEFSDHSFSTFDAQENLSTPGRAEMRNVQSYCNDRAKLAETLKYFSQAPHANGKILLSKIKGGYAVNKAGSELALLPFSEANYTSQPALHRSGEVIAVIGRIEDKTVIMQMTTPAE